MDCFAIHEMMIAQYGGRDGLRDDGLLESALNRPRHLFRYGSPSICDLAASYAVGVIRDHPFIDGNKRTGFMVAAAFLDVNGVSLIAPEEEVLSQTLALAANEIDEAQYSTWLFKNSVRTKLRRK
jgi:death-on-curing protein